MLKKKDTVQHLVFDVRSRSFTLQDKEAKVQFCKSAQEIKALACYNGCCPPAQPLLTEGHHRQSTCLEEPQDGPINLPTVWRGGAKMGTAAARLRSGGGE